ncbi:MAG TPA: MgtC/SapB family protein [Candidatus Paceibacterota bacterium]|nr:MgtC/SapB family protein [Candidatus Paceibacterota bacterium]
MITILTFTDIVVRLSVALGLGSLVGLQRSLVGKMAGMRTYALVSLGSSLFVIVSQMASAEFSGLTNFDPLRVASQVVVGIGFLGAGLIVKKENNLSGLTTAAGLWVSAGIGMASGFGFHFIALTATILILLVFTVLWYLEDSLKHLK